MSEKKIVDPRAVTNLVVGKMKHLEETFVVFARSKGYDYYSSDGCFLKPQAEVRIRKMVEDIERDASSHAKEEVLAHIRDSFLADREEIEAAGLQFWGVKNGVVDYFHNQFYTFEDFKAKFPGVYLFYRLPITYGLRRMPGELTAFLEDALKGNSDLIRKTLDGFASLLDRRPMRKRKNVIHHGPTNAGKTTFMNLEGVFMGDENTANIPLHVLCGDDKFAASGIEGKSLSWDDDMPENMLKYLGNFKKLTGGGRVWLQQKHVGGRESWTWTHFHFASNEPLPDVQHIVDEAFFDRFELVKWENVKDVGDRDGNLGAQLRTPESLSGILNLLLGLVQRQIRAGHWDKESTGVEVRETWLNQREPAIDWLDANSQKDPEGYLGKESFWEAWDAYRREHHLAFISRRRFNELVRGYAKGEAGQLWLPAVRKNLAVWKGISSKTVKTPALGSLGGFGPLILSSSASLKGIEGESKSENTPRAPRTHPLLTRESPSVEFPKQYSPTFYPMDDRIVRFRAFMNPLAPAPNGHASLPRPVPPDQYDRIYRFRQPSSMTLQEPLGGEAQDDQDGFAPGREGHPGSAAEVKHQALTAPPCQRCGAERLPGKLYVLKKEKLCEKCFEAEAAKRGGAPE